MNDESEFALSIGEIDGAVVVAPQGELDLATAPQLAGVLVEHRAGDVLIDLRGLTFIDSSGLAAVVTAWRNSSDAGGRLRCVEGSPDIHRVFVLSSLDRALDWTEAPAAITWR